MVTFTRSARFGLVVAAVVAASLASAASAGAARLDADDFASDCNDDGMVSVVGDQRYVGGHGEITRFCSVELTSGSTLVLRGVELEGTSLVAGLTVENATIRVIDSTITMSDTDPSLLGGVLELTTGGEADEPGANGAIVIRGSELTAGAILVETSFDWPDGSVTITDSTLATTQGNVSVRASDLNGSSGAVKIKSSSLLAAQDVVVSTGDPSFVGPGGGQDGSTTVRSSVLRAPAGSIAVTSGQGGQTRVRDTTLDSPLITVATGAGGTCRSVGNTPPTSCS